jgi:AcrR family transcriptional regulator
MARLKKDEREQVLETNRLLLLDAAAEEFARQGYSGANINHISQAAGFAKGTIYNYFPSKQALMEELLSATAQNHFNFISGAVRAQDCPSRRLTAFFIAGFDFVLEYLAPARVMVNIIYGANEAFKMHLFQAYRPMFQLVTLEILGPGVETGVFRQVDPVATANLLMTVYLGTASQVTDSGEFLLDARQVADFTLNSLLIDRDPDI